ncbi:hypothetical protein KTE26_19230 [Ralstonia mannitolilytica]|uniref:hypothetical protein n=1 Tax=Ralstonia mannitolilytica TaxID=105219 RepID=UPI00131579B1|nr:hypothetical protein [Ralstonia mannitolilytica]MBU9580573.1 hypothetical protein [Ralstonia mannitolilytica]
MLRKLFVAERCVEVKSVAVALVITSTLLSGCISGIVNSSHNASKTPGQDAGAKVYGRSFRLVRPADNMPVADRPYEISTEDGTVVMRGYTDEQGRTCTYQSDQVGLVSVQFGKISEKGKRTPCPPVIGKQEQ